MANIGLKFDNAHINEIYDAFSQLPPGRGSMTKKEYAELKIREYIESVWEQQQVNEEARTRAALISNQVKIKIAASRLATN